MDSVYPDPTYWIGVSNPSTTWNFEDNTVVDFYRWKDGRGRAGRKRGGRIVSWMNYKQGKRDLILKTKRVHSKLYISLVKLLTI